MLYHFALSSGRSLACARSMVLSQLAVGQLIHVFDCRWESQNRKDSLKSNRPLLASVALSLVLITMAMHVSGLRLLFGTAPLRGREWLIVLGAAALTIPLDATIQKGYQAFTCHNTDV